MPLNRIPVERRHSDYLPEPPKLWPPILSAAVVWLLTLYMAYSVGFSDGTLRLWN